MRVLKGATPCHDAGSQSAFSCEEQNRERSSYVPGMSIPPWLRKNGPWVWDTSYQEIRSSHACLALSGPQAHPQISEFQTPQGRGLGPSTGVGSGVCVVYHQLCLWSGQLVLGKSARPGAGSSALSLLSGTT